MIDHVGIHVSDLHRSKAFYAAALAPLGYTIQMEGDFGAGFGLEGKPSFWISPGVHTAGVGDVRRPRCCDSRGTP